MNKKSQQRGLRKTGERIYELLCHCGVYPLVGTWITVLLPWKAVLKPHFMHWCRVWPCMAIYGFKCRSFNPSSLGEARVISMAQRQSLSGNREIWLSPSQKYILGRAGRSSENWRVQKSQFWAQPMHKQITVFNGCCQPCCQRVLDQLSLCPGSSSCRLWAWIHLVVGSSFRAMMRYTNKVSSNCEKGE